MLTKEHYSATACERSQFSWLLSVCLLTTRPWILFALFSWGLCMFVFPFHVPNDAGPWQAADSWQITGSAWLTREAGCFTSSGLFNFSPTVWVWVPPTRAHITSLGQGQGLPKWEKETFPVSLTTFSAVWHLQRKRCAELTVSQHSAGLQKPVILVDKSMRNCALGA